MGVGDILPPCLPAHAIAQALHLADKFIPVSRPLHALVDGIHSLEFPALAPGGGTVLGVGHGPRPARRVRLEHRQTQGGAHRIVALAQLRQLPFAGVELFSILEADAVHQQMGVDVIPICVGTHQHLPSLEIFRQL